MRNIWNWIEDNAGPVMVTIAILGGFAAIIQFSVVRPMINQRFDDQQGFNAVNQRINQRNQRRRPEQIDQPAFRRPEQIDQPALRRPRQTHRGPR